MGIINENYSNNNNEESEGKETTLSKDQIHNRKRALTSPRPAQQKSERKLTENEASDKGLSEQCFINIANQYYTNKLSQLKDSEDKSGHSDAEQRESLDSNVKSDTQPTSNNSNHAPIKRISKSAMSLPEQEHKELAKTNSMGELQEHFSHPGMQSDLLLPKDIFDDDNEDERDDRIIAKHFDINIDLQTVFKKVKPIHDDYSNEEINQRSMSIISTSTVNDYQLNFYRNGEEIRRSYIAKLITKQVWKPNQKDKTHNSLIIFDWDDTLLCTSFLTPNGIFDEEMKLSEKDKEKITKLEFSVLRLLKLAVDKGDVYIITNAGPGWVEFSAEKFYPSIKPLLKRIKIISARGNYEEKYPGDNRMWKIQAFLQMKKSFDSELVTNIICLGDSFIEMEAGQILASKFTQAFIKTVKFKESPKPEELNKQLGLVADQFNGIYSPIKNLTIRVEKKKK